jgi:hypothetical protein
MSIGSRDRASGRGAAAERVAAWVMGQIVALRERASSRLLFFFQ